MSAREQIKVAARGLFADRGVDGVSVREIVAAAGLKNQGSLHYYFGTKEELVRELVIDGAKVIDDRRNAWLDELEANGGPTNIREVTDVLIFPSTRMTEDKPYFEDSYTRFIVLLQKSHSVLFMDALENRWGSGYQRCLNHLRTLMPPMPESVKNQRFIFMGAYLGSVLSLREAILAEKGRRAKRWYLEDTLKHFSQTMAAMLEVPLEAGVFDQEKMGTGKSKVYKEVSGPYGDLNI